MTDPYECRLQREQVPSFLTGLADALAEPLDLDATLDRMLDTDVGRGRWLVLPLGGPLTVSLAGERGTGSVEVRARPTGPGADELIALLGRLGAIYSR